MVVDDGKEREGRNEVELEKKRQGPKNGMAAAHGCPMFGPWLGMAEVAAADHRNESDELNKAAKDKSESTPQRLLYKSQGYDPMEHKIHEYCLLGVSLRKWRPPQCSSDLVIP